MWILHMQHCRSIMLTMFVPFDLDFRQVVATTFSCVLINLLLARWQGYSIHFRIMELLIMESISSLRECTVILEILPQNCCTNWHAVWLPIGIPRKRQRTTSFPSWAHIFVARIDAPPSFFACCIWRSAIISNTSLGKVFLMMSPSYLFEMQYILIPGNILGLEIFSNVNQPCYSVFAFYLQSYFCWLWQNTMLNDKYMKRIFWKEIELDWSQGVVLGYLEEDLKWSVWLFYLHTCLCSTYSPVPLEVTKEQQVPWNQSFISSGCWELNPRPSRKVVSGLTT